ncbi:MAG: M13-type metalloendopeptidase, partial [Nannocystaceae bacterium]
GELHGTVLRGRSGILTFQVNPDPKDPDTYIADVGQGGLGLPDRDFYLNNDEKSKGLRTKYEAHIATMLQLIGDDKATAETAAKNILAFETSLAKRSKPRAELRDPDATYNKLGFSGFAALDASVPWDAYFAGLGYPGEKVGANLNVSVPDFFKGLGKELKKAKIGTLKSYLRWHTLNASADYLTKAIVDADFEMRKALTGAEKLSPRWERCTDLTNFSLRELAGPLFVAEKFAGDNKKVALEMIAAIEGALAEALPSLEWMDDKTRARALEKMKAITNKIGYPDKWRDYSKVEVGNEFLANVLAAREFNFRHHGDKIGQKVDRGDWYMPPAMVNAYYNPSANEIVFPAGILQPPYFSQDFPMAMNFGGIGMVMGHEVTHGFDDQGRKFDGKGVLQEWWEPEVSKQFEERAQCIDKTYSEIE